MEERGNNVVYMAAASGLALLTILFLTLAGVAFAGHGDSRIGALSAVATGTREIAGTGEAGQTVAENSSLCGKCHSPCEQGRSHEGRSAAGRPDGGVLPLTEDGRATCLTCHDAHGKPEAETPSHLRVSNLRRELCLTCHLPEPEEKPELTVVSPPEGAFVQDERLALIGTATRLSDSRLDVRVNGTEFQLQTKKGEFSTWIRLRDGVNRLELAQEGRVLWAGEIFHGDRAPAGYERTASAHGTATREECQGCHDGSGARIAAEDAAGLCYTCHDRFGGKRFIHGPLAVGACLACHDPHSGYGTAHLRSEQDALCGKCHGDQDVASKPSCASRGKGCGSCHDPHQSDTRYLLKGPRYTQRQTEVAGR